MWKFVWPHILQGHRYFECADKHGVLVDPRTVLLVKAQASALMHNPIYDDGPSKEEQAIASSYLSIGADDTG